MFLLLAAGIALTRSSYILLTGRFWAEEGSVHFAHMHGEGSPLDLFFVPTRTGYLNLFANAATWTAAALPLEHAPLVTAWASLAVLLLVLWVALAWPSELLPVAWARLAAATLLLVGTLALPEVWLNAINAQVYLGILVVLLLFTIPSELVRWRFVTTVLMLAGACLSGAYAAVMAPLFVVRAVIDRSSRRIMMAAVTTAALLVQVGAYVDAEQTATGVAESRIGVPGLGTTISDIAMRQFVPLVLGQPGSARLDESARVLHDGLGAAIALGLGVLLVALIVDSTRRLTAALLVGALIAVETFVFVTALGSRVDGRYTVVPLGILTLALVFGAATAEHRPLRLTAMAVSGVVLLAGLGQFWLHRPTELRCQGCPAWTAELAAWRADPSHRLFVWPYDRDEVWTVNLGEVGQRADEEQEHADDRRTQSVALRSLMRRP